MDILKAVVSASDDPRGFRRVAVSVGAGVRLSGDSLPHRATSGAGAEDRGLCYRSVTIENLSLTGLLFADSLPYRLGLCLEVRLPLDHGVIFLPTVVRRQEKRRGPDSALPGGTTYGCGVSFRLSEIPPDTRRKLTEFLVRRAPEVQALFKKDAAATDFWPGYRPL